MALTKADMAEKLFEELGLNKREAKEIVEEFFEEVRVALEHGQQVTLSGFGNFDLRDKNQRPGRNPKTGQEIPITARRVVTFRPGQKLKSGCLLQGLVNGFKPTPGFPRNIRGLCQVRHYRQPFGAPGCKLRHMLQLYATHHGKGQIAQR